MLKGPNLLMENTNLIWIGELNVIFSVPVSAKIWVLEEHHFEILLCELLSFVHEQVLWKVSMLGIFISLNANGVQ